MHILDILLSKVEKKKYSEIHEKVKERLAWLERERKG